MIHALIERIDTRIRESRSLNKCTSQSKGPMPRQAAVHVHDLLGVILGKLADLVDANGQRLPSQMLGVDP